MATTAVAALLAVPHRGIAGPAGGTVVGGAATISQSGSTTTINQSSNNAIINWQGFSIGTGETVNFNQPNSGSATLNRVIGNEQSIISGALNANGHVFIVNANGVLFTRGAQVNVGGLVATTLDISNSDFMAGNYTFSGSSSAAIINQGHIHAHGGGYIALLGKTVSNDGVIVAKMGTVAMAAGDKITLNFAGNSLIDVTIDQGTLNALVQNKRAIIANGGNVILTARAADQILSAQVNNSGIIQARTMAALKGGSNGTRVVHKGSIRLLAQGGTVSVSGMLDASAPKGGDGGFIETSGDKVKIADSAVITTVSASGQNGSWLIDPDGFTIAATGGDITGAKLSSELALTDVTISSTDGHGADGNINVNDAVTWSSNGTTLTLNATNSINVNAAITAGGIGDGLVLNATNGGITINAAVGTPSIVTSATFALTLNAPSANGFIAINAPLTVTQLAMTVPTAIVEQLPSATTSATTVTVNDPSPTSFDVHGNYSFGANGVVNFIKTDAATFTPGETLTINTETFSATGVATTTTANYTLITSADQLNQIANLTNGKGVGTVSGNFALAADIDLSGTTYAGAVIATLGAGSTFAGLGHTISGLTIVDLAGTGIPVRSAGVQDGFIGIAANTAVVRDLNLTNVNINNVVTVAPGQTGGIASLTPDQRADHSQGAPISTLLGQTGTNVGGAVGANQGVIYGVSVSTGASGFIVGAQNVGGVAGESLATGVIINSHADVNVLAWNGQVGGLVGDMLKTLINSSAAGTVENDTLLINGSLTPAQGIGGLVGLNNGGNIYGSTSSASATAFDALSVGGLVGQNSAALNFTTGAVTGGGIFDSSASGAVSLTNKNTDLKNSNTANVGVGGLVGVNTGGVLVRDSASGDVTATGVDNGSIGGAGGLVGMSGPQLVGGAFIIDSQATGNVSATGSVTNVGGFAGKDTNTFISDSSATGNVTTASGLILPPPGAVGAISKIVNPTSVGGFAGQSGGGAITGSSASGAVSGPGINVGGFLGNNSPGTSATTLSGNTFDGVRSGQQNGVGSGGGGAGVSRFIDPIFPTAATSGNGAQSGALTAATNPPNSAMSTAGTAAATVPSSLALDANLRAVEIGVAADDRRIRRRVTAAATTTRRPGLGATIRDIEINGKRMNPDQRNDAPAANPQ